MPIRLVLAENLSKSLSQHMEFKMVIQPKGGVRPKYKRPYISFLIICLLIVLSGASNLIFAQSAHPIKKKALLDVLRTNVVPTARLVQEVQRRGVDFKMTAADENEIRLAGGRPELIEAVRVNYRPSTTVATKSGSSSKSTSNVPPGPPLAKNEVITMLQSGVATTRVEQFVTARGVNFKMTPQIAKEIKAAGGNNALIGAITQMASGKAPTPITTTASASTKSAAPTYDDLTDQAVEANKIKDADSAIRLLQQAISMDPSQPMAYQLLGFVQLYSKNNVTAAKENMKLAVEKGGAAVFRTFHDHAEGTFASYCEGSLFVTKTDVTFKADDGKDTFEAIDQKIKEAKTNRFVGFQYGAFHIKVDLGNGSKNYNFAPATKQKSEAKMITELIESYK
jgi:hypothetical protein